MITITDTPACADPVSPSIISRWLATESPNIFTLLRQDFLISGYANNGGFLQITVDGSFSGNDDDVITVYDATTESMRLGLVTDASADPVIETDIPWEAGFDIEYMNDHTLRAGYYAEGRLTINGVLYPLTIMASPDTKGICELDVSGILRIVTSLGKIGDYSEVFMAETNKSGRFSFEYRECWYGADNEWYPEGGSISPPSDEIMWYYAEAVRSEEQGSNLSEYVATEISDAPFLNSFEVPVLFVGLPFDISFILPEQPDVSPAGDLTATIRIYNRANTQLGAAVVYNIPIADLDGRVVSLTIDPATIPAGASHLTAEITT